MSCKSQGRSSYHSLGFQNPPRFDSRVSHPLRPQTDLLSPAGVLSFRWWKHLHGRPWRIVLPAPKMGVFPEAAEAVAYQAAAMRCQGRYSLVVRRELLIIHRFFATIRCCSARGGREEEQIKHLPAKYQESCFCLNNQVVYITSEKKFYKFFLDRFLKKNLIAISCRAIWQSPILLKREFAYCPLTGNNEVIEY